MSDAGRSAGSGEGASGQGGGVLAADLYERSLDCVHCGLCLSACPTYRETGRETSSPRGRIYLMRGVAEGKLEAGELLAEEAFLCLGCRACETACPSGVEYGAMLERAREAVVDRGLRQGSSGWASRVERGLLRTVVAHRGRLRLALSALGLTQRLGLDRLAANVLPEGLATLVRGAPRVPGSEARRPLPTTTAAHGSARGVVALFTGCVMSEIFGDVHRATAEVLAANGFEVWTPPSQGCCGALHAHAGDRRFAEDLARHNARVFAEREVLAIVLNSAGCGAAMREADHWIGDAGRDMAEAVRDICEWIDEQGWTAPLGPIAGQGSGASGAAKVRVCYDDPCHLIHGQRVGRAPRRLLAAIPNVELVEHADAAACCGAAGTYNLTQPEMSQRVLSRKLDALEAAAPDIVTSGNPGCLMQLASGVEERGIGARVVHPAVLLAEAVRNAR